MNPMAWERVNSRDGGGESSLLSLLLSQWSAFYQTSISGLIYFHSYLVYLKARYSSSQILAHIWTTGRKLQGMKSPPNRLCVFVGFFSLASGSWSEVGSIAISSDLFKKRLHGQGNLPFWEGISHPMGTPTACAPGSPRIGIQWAQRRAADHRSGLLWLLCSESSMVSQIPARNSQWPSRHWMTWSMGISPTSLPISHTPY